MGMVFFAGIVKCVLNAFPVIEVIGGIVTIVGSYMGLNIAQKAKEMKYAKDTEIRGE